MFDEFCQNVKFDFRIYKPNKHKMSLNVKLGGLSRIFTAVESVEPPNFIKKWETTDESWLRVEVHFFETTTRHLRSKRI